MFLTRWRQYQDLALREDLLAALVVSVLLIPQSLAYALLAGLPAHVGLYASLLPLVLYAALGSSPNLGVGPVAVLALMIGQTLALAPAGISASDAALVLAAEVGLLMAAAALLRLDALASLLSVPVLHGFETGAALSIAMSQLPVLLGSPVHGNSIPQLWEQLQQTWQSGAQAWLPLTAAYGLATVLALWLARRYAVTLLQRWMPVARATMLARLLPLLILIVAIAIAAGTGASRQGVALVGALPALHIPLGLPLADWALWRTMFPGALLIALVGYVSSLVVGESLARKRGQRVEPRRELAGLAGANLAAAFTGGMPVAASFSRSVLMMDAGSRTRMAGVWTAAFMAIAMLFLSAPLAALPTAVLAATIVVAVLSVISLTPFVEAWRYSRPECVLMVAVAVLTLLWGVSAALGLGVLGSVALLLQRTAKPHVALIGRVPGTEHYRNVERHEVECLDEVLGLRIDESLLFTNARSLTDVVQQHLAQHAKAERVVLLMSPVNSIDLSGLEALRDLHATLARQGVRLDLSEVKGPVLDRLKASDWQRWFKGRVFLSHHHGMLES
ncbi:MAG: STAS domain-containing protein [Burkholderiaceae bacterium]|nr:STAS domain-containing protein [Burkholderiaceae bacterium]